MADRPSVPKPLSFFLFAACALFISYTVNRSMDITPPPHQYISTAKMGLAENQGGWPLHYLASNCTTAGEEEEEEEEKEKPREG